ncbi:MAG TPA: efflux RND transporter periplasmic adaptor subunit [Gemmataceae bacterium]|jgi:multidrug resistance efflux pump|nr:efflux RND transporter periplasmic adaptor subunit [Gemmataceae bacterium]
MKKISIIVSAAIVGAAAVSLGFFWPFSASHETLKLPGTVEVQEIRLASKIGGRVKDVYVKEGDTVEAGRELLRFDTPELQAQRDQVAARLQAAKAELLKAENGPRVQEKAEAKALMEMAQARWERMKTGWREEEKQQARDDWASAEADMKLAQNTFDRMEKLYPQQTSQTEYDTARFRLAAMKGRERATRSKMTMLEKGNRDEDKTEAEADFIRAKAHSELLQEGTREEDKDLARANVGELEAKLKELQANLDEAVVVAPSPIVVEVISVRKGDVLAPNQPVIRALKMDDRWVKVFVPSTDLGKIRLHQKVEATCDAYPNKRFPGEVIQIATISEFTPRNVQSVDERRHQVFGVKVRMDDNGEVFRAGMYAEVHVPLQEAP